MWSSSSAQLFFCLLPCSRAITHNAFLCWIFGVRARQFDLHVSLWPAKGRTATKTRRLLNTSENVIDDNTRDDNSYQIRTIETWYCCEKYLMSAILFTAAGFCVDFCQAPPGVKTSSGGFAPNHSSKYLEAIMTLWLTGTVINACMCNIDYVWRRQSWCLYLWNDRHPHWNLIRKSKCNFIWCTGTSSQVSRLELHQRKI